MLRASFMVLLSAGLVLAAPQNKKSVVGTDTPIYRAQGEYLGEFTVGENTFRAGAQAIALSDTELRLVVYDGGLPGAGWARGDERHEVTGKLVDGVAKFVDEKGITATLKDGKIQFASPDGKDLGSLGRVERQSPTLGAKPPKGAVVLFDGSNADAFENGKMTAEGTLAMGTKSNQKFGDHRVHLEFKTPFMPFARGQGRGNSGVYYQHRYETQVLDSFGLEGKSNECGGIYGIREPNVNACLPPEQWQTYDVYFRAARWKDGKKVQQARITVHLNGILVHEDVELPKGTTAGQKEAEGPGPLYMQNHGNPVEYRNIWVQELDDDRKRNIVFIPGRRSHGFGSHEHKAGSMLLAKCLNESDLNVTATVLDSWPEDTAVLDGADSLVIYSDGGRGHPLLRHMEELGQRMRDGLGLVCLHYAVEVPKGVPGDRFVDWIGGYFETHWSVNPHWVAEFKAMPNHPVARGVNPFTINDEWYYHMRFRPRMEGVSAVLSAIPPASTLKRKDGPHSGNPHVRAAAGTPQHVAWARVRPGGGRGFGFTGGHVHWNWGHPDFRKLVLNAIAWSAHHEVPENGVQSSAQSLQDLLENQDFEPRKNFNAERVEQMLREWSADDR